MTMKVIKLIIIITIYKAAGIKHIIQQGMTATASNRSQTCLGRRPHFPFGGLLTTA